MEQTESFIESVAVESQQEEASGAGLVEEMCEEHQRKLEIICIQDRMRICSTCALFGQHKGHEVR